MNDPYDCSRPRRPRRNGEEAVTEPELRELLKWIYMQTREALFERTHKRAGQAALDACSRINHKLAVFK